MFAVRGILISFSIFALFYCALSLLVCSLWRRVWRCAPTFRQRLCADVLFSVRMAPLVVASGITLILAVPSFLLLEPHAGTESLGILPMALGACGIGLTIAGLWKAATAWMRASRMLAEWSREATFVCSSPVYAKQSVFVMRTSNSAPPLTAAGVLRPTVWLSRAAEFVLTERELKSALQHEAVHVRRRDNLRKLLMRLAAFPGMARLENAWRETTEMAADDEAVASASEALDLAAAVIKLSRLASLQPAGELTSALVHSPAEAVNARVERLIAWNERSTPASRLSSRSAFCIAIAAVVSLALTYSYLLVRVHAATEWLVR